MSLKIFLGSESERIPSDLLTLYLKRNLFVVHQNKVGIWLDYPLNLEGLGLKVNFLESLLKKVSVDYTSSLNPIKLNLYFEPD